MRETERAQRFCFGQSSTFRVALRWWVRSQIDYLQLVIETRRDYRRRSAVHRDERRAKCLVTANDLGKALLQGADIGRMK